MSRGPRDLRHQGRAGVDAGQASRAYSTFERKPVHLGVDLSWLTWTPSHYVRLRRTWLRPTPGTTCPRHQEQFSMTARHPEAEASAPGGRRVVPPVRVEVACLPQIRGDLRSRASSSWTLTPPCASTPSSRQGVLRDRGACRRQQVRRPLNTAVWSGPFIHVPKGVHEILPRPTSASTPRTWASSSARSSTLTRTPTSTTRGLHRPHLPHRLPPLGDRGDRGQEDARVRYTTIQNWSNNVHNLVTPARYLRGGRHHGVGRRKNIGSKRNMSTRRLPHGPREVVHAAFAGAPAPGHGASMVHMAPHTPATSSPRSPARHGTQRLPRDCRSENAPGTPSPTCCATRFLVDETPAGQSTPYVDVRTDDVEMGHEATVLVSADQLFYLMQRGLTETEAMAVAVCGFVEPIAWELPMEYARASPAHRAADGESRVAGTHRSGISSSNPPQPRPTLITPACCRLVSTPHA